MPVYPLRCQECGARAERFAPISVGKSSTNCDCGSVLRRVWTPPAIAKPWIPHFNHAVGQFCETERDFTQALRRGSEEASKLMGRDVNYVRIDPQEAKPKSEEGLAEQQKAHRDRGWVEAKKTIVPLS